MRIWAGALGTLSLAAAASVDACASPSLRLAQLQTSITGEGNVSAEYATTGGYTAYLNCEGGVCDSYLGGGSAYEPGVNVTLTAAPSPGWQFMSWRVTVWGKDGPSDHSSVTTTSTEATLLVQNAGQQMYVFATFGVDANDADASTVDASAPDSPSE